MPRASKLRFERSELSSLCGESIGEAFGHFTAEVLATSLFPGLHLFPDAGKDGGIDFSVDTSSGRVVGECKLVSSGAFVDVVKRWREVSDRLQRNLVSRSGPPSGQSQYGPWYATDPPIVKYVFCTSAIIKNQEKLDQLKRLIRDDLRALGRDHVHLRHLRNVKVLVLDWQKLLNKASAQTEFRWFVARRPRGLVPIDVSTQADVGTFREYLRSDRMPYYSLQRHLAEHADAGGSAVEDERRLVALLEGTEHLGVLIAGAGGLGKTRLTLEIGKEAARQGWIVLRAHPPVNPDTLDELMANIGTDRRVLLLFDYIETQPTFPAVAERIDSFGATYEVVIRYVANCRTSYLPRVRGIRAQHVVDLSPVATAPTSSWRRAYRTVAVRHILEAAGLGRDDRELEVAGDRPILAIFLAYLHRTGRGDELSDLLGSGDFGAWIARRTELSFEGESVTRDLALLCASLPMSQSMPGFPSERFQPLVDRLAADGWIEPAVEGQMPDAWRPIHDVMTDQIVATYLSGIPATAGAFAEDLLKGSAASGSIDSALVSIQRLADLPEIKAINWVVVFGSSLTHAPDVWAASRELLLQTPLLGAGDLLTLLSSHAEVWAGMDEDLSSQDALARLSDRIEEEQITLTADQEATLKAWLVAAASKADFSTLALTRALRRYPEDVRDDARRWLNAHALTTRASFVLSEWLRSDLDATVVEAEVARWVIRYRTAPYAGRLLASWLANGTDPESARQATVDWLALHGASDAAAIVYKEWLESFGREGMDDVRDGIEEWLSLNGSSLSARFIFDAWLNVGGGHELDVVHDNVLAWLQLHETDTTASFVYHRWLDNCNKDDLVLVRASLQKWAIANTTYDEAQFVYQSWLNAGDEEDILLVRQPLSEWLALYATELRTAFVYKEWIDAGGDLDLVRKPLASWLEAHHAHEYARFVYNPWLIKGGELALVRDWVTTWLATNEGFRSADVIRVSLARAEQRDKAVKPPA